MSEGYRAAPWFQEMSRRKQIAIDDCKQCMRTTDQMQRQSLGCGYEPRTDRVSLQVWQPPSPSGDRTGYVGPPLTHCAGYTARLPQVVEAYIARAHWLKGNVPMHMTPDDLLNAILIVNVQHDAMEAWRMTEES